MKKQIPKGNVMLILTLFISLVGTTVIMTSTKSISSDVKNSADLFQTKQSFATAESGFEDVVYRLKSGRQVGSLETITIGNSTSDTIINTINSATESIKELITTSRFRTNERLLTSYLTTNEEISFSYGIQVGEGGLSMGNNSVINGNVYSNGSITGGIITGTAISANRSTPFSDQSNGVGLNPNHAITFGDNGTRPDFAQSFMVSTPEIPSKVRFYMRKVGNPVNPTVTIRSDSGGNPGTNIFATATLNSSLVTTNYDWIEVPISSTSLLNTGTTFWVVVDMPSFSAGNYYQIAGSLSTYPNGLAKVGVRGGTFYSTTPNIVTNSDGFFEVYLGGYTGRIMNTVVGTNGYGDAWANFVTNTTVAGNLYCTTGSSNNKNCNTSREDPVEIPLPISNSNINEWKDVAATGTVINSSTSVTSNQTFGNTKINGSLAIANGAVLNLTGILWVTGDMSLNNNAQIRLDPSYGSLGGMVIVDGRIIMSNNATMRGSGSQGSYIMAISLSFVEPSISVSNNAGSEVIFVAPNGSIILSNNASAKALVTRKVGLNNNTTINYETGLANANFSLGPSGSWQIGSWKEGD